MIGDSHRNLVIPQMRHEWNKPCFIATQGGRIWVRVRDGTHCPKIDAIETYYPDSFGIGKRKWSFQAAISVR